MSCKKTAKVVRLKKARGEMMKTVDRQKICPNCDGRVPYDATQCSYCFTPLHADTTSKFFTPPYLSRPNDAEPSPTVKALHQEAQPVDTKSFWPLFLLFMGGNLFVLGILQFFFSDHGVVRLEINANYWFLMLLISIPMFYFGIKNVQGRA